MAYFSSPVAMSVNLGTLEAEEVSSPMPHHIEDDTLTGLLDFYLKSSSTNVKHEKATPAMATAPRPGAISFELTSMSTQGSLSPKRPRKVVTLPTSIHCRPDLGSVKSENELDSALAFLSLILLTFSTSSALLPPGTGAVRTANFNSAKVKLPLSCACSLFLHLHLSQPSSLLLLPRDGVRGHGDMPRRGSRRRPPRGWRRLRG